MSISPVSGLQAASIIVDPTAGKGNYTTIAAAITAASSGQTILIKSGTYAENLSLKAGVNLSAFGSDGKNVPCHVIISGTATCTTAGTVATYSGINFTSTVTAAIVMSGSATGTIYLQNCTVSSTGVPSIIITAAGDARITLDNCNVITNHKIFEISGGGGISFYQCVVGSSTVASTSSSTGGIRISYTYWTGIFSLTNAFISADHSFFIITDSTIFTIGSSSTNTIDFCEIKSGTASAISVSTNLTISDSIIQSSNTNAITGAGTVVFSGLSFTGTSHTINTTTQTNKFFIPGAMNTVLPAGDYTILGSDMFVGATSSAARAITLPASPVAGQQHIVKDITGSAGTNNITVSGNGSNILGATSAATYVMNVNYGSTTFVYTGTVWAVI